jgi:hypothetical protein
MEIAIKCFQSFDYTIQHVKGSENIIADSFSRLCSIDETYKDSKNYSKEFLCPLVELEAPRDAWTKIKKAHNATLKKLCVAKLTLPIIKNT